MHEGSRKAVLAALVANAGIAVAKLVGFLVTRSSSMLAESVHSLADSSNQGLLLLGGARASRDATADHPFGFGRERYFWSFVVALVIFSLGALFAVYEGISKIRHPHEVQSAGVAVGILLVGIVLETFSLRTAVVEANRVRRGQSWVAFVRHSRVPELPVVLLEDIGAMAGLVLALAGVGLTELTGDAIWDGIGTVSIGVLLGIIAVVLMVEMQSLLIGESASVGDRRRLVSTMESTAGVVRVLHVRTQHLGPDELLVGAKVELDGDLSFAEVAATIDRIESRVREAVPAARVLYVEPDIHRADLVDPKEEDQP